MRMIVGMVVLLLATPVAAEPTISSAERQTLQRIFETTGGATWKFNDGWLRDEDPCNWFGVICDYTAVGQSMTVVGLYLPFNNLQGSLPLALQNLTALRTLDLRGNGLTGVVPERWLERWDKNEFELFLSGNCFLNFPDHVRISFSSPSVLCAFDEDTHYTIDLTDGGAARFESIRCASRHFDSRETYCLVKDGDAPYLDRLGRALKRVGFEELAASYSYPFTFATHQVFVTTTVWYGDGRMQQLETYGGMGPVETHVVEQLVWALARGVEWKHTSHQKQCTLSP